MLLGSRFLGRCGGLLGGALDDDFVVRIIGIGVVGGAIVLPIAAEGGQQILSRGGLALLALGGLGGRLDLRLLALRAGRVVAVRGVDLNLDLDRLLGLLGLGGLGGRDFRGLLLLGQLLLLLLGELLLGFFFGLNGFLFDLLFAFLLSSLLRLRRFN